MTDAQAHALAKARLALQAKAAANAAELMKRIEALHWRISDEHKRQLAYIEQQCSLDRDPADLAVLRERREEILSRYERTAAATLSNIEAAVT